MDENVGTTQERPALRNARRRSAPTFSQNPASRNERQSRSAKPRNGEGARASRHARQTSSAQRNNSHPYAAGNRNKSASNRKRSAPRRSGIPIPVVLIIVLVSVVAAVLITRGMLLQRIKEAEQQTAQAKSQVNTLTEQLDKISKESATQTSTDSKSDSKSSDSKDSSSTTSSTSKIEEKKASTGVEDPWTKSGTYTSGDSVLDGEVKAYCDSLVDASMEINTAALEVYKGIAWSDYVERDAAQHPSGKNWRIEFARMYYENGCSGNCYEFASFLSYCLQYLGFEDATSQGVLVELQSGGWGDHGVVYVTNTDGTACICDTARGTDGWMLPQGSYNVQMQDFESA